MKAKKTTIGDLAGMVQRGFLSVTKDMARKDNMDWQFEEVDRQFAEVKERFDGIDERLDRIERVSF